MSTIDARLNMSLETLARSRASASGSSALGSPAPPPPPPPVRTIAWPLGKLSSNKSDAVAAFLEKRAAKRLSLSKEELELIARFTPTAAARAEEIVTAVSTGAPLAAAAAPKRKREEEPAEARRRDGRGGRSLGAVGAPAPPLSLDERMGMPLGAGVARAPAAVPLRGAVRNVTARGGAARGGAARGEAARGGAARGGARDGGSSGGGASAGRRQIVLR